MSSTDLSLNLFKSLAHFCPVGISVSNVKDKDIYTAKIIFANRSVAITLRSDVSVIVGRSARELFPGMMGTDFIVKLQTAIQNQQPEKTKIKYGDRFFSEGYYEFTFFPLGDYLIMYGSNISLPAKLENDFRERTHELNEMKKSLSQKEEEIMGLEKQINELRLGN